MMMSIRSVDSSSVVANDATSLLKLLQSSAYTQEVAKNKFGFRAYDRLSKLRTLAITHPGEYLKAKTIKVMGGNAPTDDERKAAKLTTDDVKVLYGVALGAKVPSIAESVATAYSDTLTQLYDAGADEATADKYASAVAQSLLQSKMVVHESEFPDPVSNTSEKNLLLNQLGSVGGRIALTAPKVGSSALVRK